MLYREPKLLKADLDRRGEYRKNNVSVLYREPKLLKEEMRAARLTDAQHVSVLYREPKLLKATQSGSASRYNY